MSVVLVVSAAGMSMPGSTPFGFHAPPVVQKQAGILRIRSDQKFLGGEWPWVCRRRFRRWESWKNEACRSASDLALVGTSHELVIIASEYTKGVGACALRIRGVPAGATEGVCLPSVLKSRFFESAPLVPRPGLQVHR